MFPNSTSEIASGGVPESVFEDLFYDAPVAYHELDEHGLFIRINGTELTMLGYTACEMVGHPVWDFIVEKVSRKAIAMKIAGEMPLEPYERTFRRKDGTTVPVLMQDRLIRGSDGRVHGIRTTCVDIRTRKEMERELEEARDAALDSVRLKSEFLANMSHGIRAPIKGIIGMAGQLLDTGLSEQQRDFAETIQASAESLLTIISDLLDVSNIETGTLGVKDIDPDVSAVKANAACHAENVDRSKKSLDRDAILHRAERLLALARQMRQLGKLLAICAYCKRIRDDGIYWQQMESYIQEHTGAHLSHSVCPECFAEQMDELDKGRLRTVFSFAAVPD